MEWGMSDSGFLSLQLTAVKERLGKDTQQPVPCVLTHSDSRLHPWAPDDLYFLKTIPMYIEGH